MAGRLAAQGAPGDRVAVLAWNCPEFIELIYGASAAGKVLVPLNARLAPAELLYQLQSAQVSLLFGDPTLLRPLLDHVDFPADLPTVGVGAEYQAWLAASAAASAAKNAAVALPATAGDDPAWILYTSGTTGRPKGAVLTQRSLVAGLRSAALGRPVLPGDRYLYPFPLFHVAAHNVLLQHQFGAAVVLLPAFDAATTLRLCRELQVTTLSLAPTMIAMLLDHPRFTPDDLASVRSIGYGASAMPPDLLQRLLAVADVDLCQSYGMTELSGSIAFLTPADHRLAVAGESGLLRSVGKPLPTASVRLKGEPGQNCTNGQRGEILVRGEQCMQAYWRQPEASAEAITDGWLHTGDIGCLDENGYLFIVDRKKDMIISGGENIASREVEEVLRRHPAVRDCAVIGKPDRHWGESVCAVLELHWEVADSDLALFCRKQLAGYKTPKTWIRLRCLPVNAGGKIDKAQLRQAVTTGHGEDSTHSGERR